MSTSQFADLEIRIIRRQEADTVELTLNNEQQFGPRPIDLNDLQLRTSDSPEEQGRQLCDWLLTDKQLNASWAEICGRFPRRRIRLRIDIDAPEFHSLPWELLREVRADRASLDLAAAASTPFSRYIAGSWHQGSPVFQRPLNVLVLIPAPTNLAALRLPDFDFAKEWEVLQNSVKGLEVELTQLPSPCTMSVMENELRKGYHVLHIITHGIFEQDQSVIVMEDSNKQSALVTETEFSELLRRMAAEDPDAESKLPRLIYLDSCETAMRDSSDAFRGFAPALVKAGIPAVIAMQELVAVDTAQAFASTFYRQLLTHGQVDLACNEARSALITARLPGAAIPVLFMRLADGVLLGTHGRISGEMAEDFWPFLVDNIEAGKCVPIIGPGVLSGLIPSSAYVAELLAKEFGYPLEDVGNMARVAQFMQTNNPTAVVNQFNKIARSHIGRNFSQHLSDAQKKELRNASFPELVNKVGWSAQIQQIQENEIHHLLAQLGLPLYLTTNFDNFMAEALRSIHPNPDAKDAVRQIGIRWQQPSSQDHRTDKASESNQSNEWALLPYPSPEKPVVLHLNGFQGDEEQEQNMIFSEDDYLNQFARITQQRDHIFPANLLGMLAQSSFLLIGFNLDDWEFRLVIQGFLPTIAQITNNPKTKKRHVGIQLDSAELANSEKVIEYVTKFLGRFNIDVYWGTPKQFANELHNIWQQRPEDDDDPFK